MPLRLPPIQVKLMQRMKEDANKMKQMDLQHHRAISQLRKEHRKHENTVSGNTATWSVETREHGQWKNGNMGSGWWGNTGTPSVVGGEAWSVEVGNTGTRSVETWEHGQ